jgi:trigger factor
MYQGIRLADYLKMTGMTMEQLRNDYRETAEKSVRTQLVLEAIKNAEGIEATDEQAEEELKKRAETYKKDLEEYRKDVRDEEMEYIRDNIAYDNTVNFLVENAKLKAPKKKTKKDKAEKENKTEE